MDLDLRIRTEVFCLYCTGEPATRHLLVEPLLGIEAEVFCLCRTEVAGGTPLESDCMAGSLRPVGLVPEAEVDMEKPNGFTFREYAQVSPHFVDHHSRPAYSVGYLRIWQVLSTR